MRAILAILLSLIFLSSHAFAQAVGEAEEAVRDAEIVVKEMKELGFSTSLPSDIILEMKQLVSEKKSLADRGGKVDYSDVIGKGRRVSEIMELALQARDEQAAFEKNLMVVEKDIDVTEASVFLNDAKKEIYDERYGMAIGLIDKAYEKLSESQSTSTRLKAFYEATSQSIGSFILSNWHLILAFILVSSAGVPVVWKKMRINALSAELENLKVERGILGGLIKSIQSEYFEKMTLSDNTYYLRLKKFTEMIRDIDSRIPLVKEELGRVSKAR